MESFLDMFEMDTMKRKNFKKQHVFEALCKILLMYDYDNGGQAAISHHNTDIALSPNANAAHQFIYKASNNINFNWTSKYVSKQYLDNTQNDKRTLKPYFINDLSIAYTLTKKINRTALLQFYVLNFMDVKYEPNGYTYSYVYGGTTTTSNNYFPMAGRNFLLSLKLDFK